MPFAIGIRSEQGRKSFPLTTQTIHSPSFGDKFNHSKLQNYSRTKSSGNHSHNSHCFCTPRAGAASDLVFPCQDPSPVASPLLPTTSNAIDQLSPDEGLILLPHPNKHLFLRLRHLPQFDAIFLLHLGPYQFRDSDFQVAIQIPIAGVSWFKIGRD